MAVMAGDAAGMVSGRTESGTGLPRPRQGGGVGVFDFDAVVFRDLWERGDRKRFNAYLRYYLSDHRMMWVEVG